jgi:hypothetical protein
MSKVRHALDRVHFQTHRLVDGQSFKQALRPEWVEAA